MSTIGTDAAGHIDALSTSDVAERIQTSVQTVPTASIVETVTESTDSWGLLRGRLNVLMAMDDSIAHVGLTLTSPGTHRRYLSVSS